MNRKLSGAELLSTAISTFALSDDNINDSLCLRRPLPVASASGPHSLYSRNDVSLTSSLINLGGLDSSRRI